MKRHKKYFFIGIALLLLPLLGFSVSFKNTATIILGLLLCLFSYTAIGTRSFFQRGPKQSFRDIHQSQQSTFSHTSSPVDKKPTV